MRAAIIIAVGLLSLTACGQPQEKREVSEYFAPKTVVSAPDGTGAPVDLESACRDVVNRSFGQDGDAVTYKAAGADRAEVSWRAPVDGGVLSFECRADGDRVGLFRDGRSMSVDVQMTAPAAEEEAR